MTVVRRIANFPITSPIPNMTTRRAFLKTCSTAASAAAVGVPILGNAAEPAKQEFCIFTKHLQGLEFKQIADIIASAGAAGVEAPGRPGGHVEPARIEDDLPKLMNVLQEAGLKMTILTSAITEVSDAQMTEKVLRTAKSLGVQRYRMGVCKYDLKQPIIPQLEALSPKFKELIALSREIGIQPLFQNHSGKDYVGAPIWDIFALIKDYPAKDWSMAFDIYHATVEGSKSWPLEVNLIRDYIGAAYFKDFKWGAKGAETCPLGEGVVSREYVAMLKKFGYSGPVSLHVEYLEGSAKDKDYVELAAKATKRDFATLKTWWK